MLFQPYGSIYAPSAFPRTTRSVVVKAPTLEPLSVETGKLRAGQVWAPGDPRESLMVDWIATARSQVEQDTGLALLTQTRDVYLGELAGLVPLPAQSFPLQSVVSITVSDAANATTVLDPSTYQVDTSEGVIGLVAGEAWPTGLRSLAPCVVRIIAGYDSLAALKANAPGLIHAVGLLVAHYATLGRDVAVVDSGTVQPMVYGYETAIAPYRRLVVA